MGVILAIVLVGAVVLLGGGNTLKGLGSDLRNTGATLENNVNGREPAAAPAATPRPSSRATVPSLPATSTYNAPPTLLAPSEATSQRIPAVESSN